VNTKIVMNTLTALATVMLLAGCNGDDTVPPPSAGLPLSTPVAVAPGGCPIESPDATLLYPNTLGAKFSPALVTTTDGGFLYFSSDHNGTQDIGSQDIYVSEMRPDGTYGPGVAVAALNTSFEDQQPNVSRDGLTIVFASNRGGNMDVYMSTRSSLTSEWSPPRNLSIQLAFPTPGLAETQSSVSWDM
jgi:hypothetical protein